MAWSWRVWALVLVLGGCASTPPSTAGLAPPPSGWYAFCALHDPGSRLCDPVPAATAMPEGGRAPAPPGWRDYCRRVLDEAACAAGTR